MTVLSGKALIHREEAMSMSPDKLELTVNRRIAGEMLQHLEKLLEVTVRQRYDIDALEYEGRIEVIPMGRGRREEPPSPNTRPRSELPIDIDFEKFFEKLMLGGIKPSRRDKYREEKYGEAPVETPVESKEEERLRLALEAALYYLERCESEKAIDEIQAALKGVNV